MKIFRLFNSNLIVFDQFLYAGLTLLFTSIFAAELSTQQFAELNLFITTAMILVGYFRAFINQPQAIIYKNGENYNKEVAYALISALIVIYFFYLIFSFFFLNKKNIISIISVFPILIFVNQLSRDIYSVLRFFKKLIFISFIYLTVYLLFRFVSISISVYFTVVCLSIFWIYTTASCFKSNDLFFTIKQFFIKTWSFSRWIVVANTVFIFTSSLIPFVLITKFGAVETKNYYIFMSVLAVFNPLMRGFYLKFMNQSEKNFRITKIFFYYSLLSLPIISLALYILPKIFFIESIGLFGFPLIIIMSGVVWTKIIYFTIDLNFNIAKKNKTLLIVSGIRFMPVILIFFSDSFSLEFLSILLLTFNTLEIFILYIIDNEKLAFNLS